MDQEEWKDIFGFKGLYQVSSFGRIKRLGRKVTVTLNGSNSCRIINDKILTLQKKAGNGYLYITLTKQNKRKSFYIHRIVAYHFCKYKGYFITCEFLSPWRSIEVDHADRNKLNNYAINLSFATRSENQRNTTRCFNAKSKYNGVYVRKHIFEASVTVKKKYYYIGRFRSEKKAAREFDNFVKKNKLERSLNFENNN